MKILTPAQMREVDRLTIEAGIPGLILMENAGCRCVEFLERRFAPLSRHRIVIICGKGNNGGDGLVIARQLKTRLAPASLDVVLGWGPEEFHGEAAENWKMLEAVGVPASSAIAPGMRAATLVIDALLGTGLTGPARGRALELIREMNDGFPGATLVSVDIPSGLCESGESVRAAHTITFTAPKAELVLPPTCDRVGELHVAPIGMPAGLLYENPDFWLELIEPPIFRAALEKRSPGAHKGDFGHVLIIGGAEGKGGAAAMAGWAALKAGAGLVTVATAEAERRTVTALAPELMTQDWGADPGDKDVLAAGPGLGADPHRVAAMQRLFAQSALPLIVDADGLNALAGTAFQGPGPWRVLTPHPGEMARLAGCAISDIQANRIGLAQRFAVERHVALVLKGQRTIVALRDGRVFVNPTGTPAMATAGSGDVLTGLIAGLMAQWPERREQALLAAVWLHGRAGELGAGALTEQCLTATDLIRHLPGAIADALA
ncbi:MAG: NAD(P)H-hydrate dehydratase [Acidobacteria bacterium]|nr:NAD(P)H-hydrate dehydratase [Acidobacteriota bacterium]